MLMASSSGAWRPEKSALWQRSLTRRHRCEGVLTSLGRWGPRHLVFYTRSGGANAPLAWFLQGNRKGRP